jgi:ankyrin repeat protein
VYYKNNTGTSTKITYLLRGIVKHQFPTPHPAKRPTQSFIPEDAWSIIASFSPINDQFSVLHTSARIQQTALNSILQDKKISMILFQKSVHGYNVITQFLLSHELFDPSACDNAAIIRASHEGHVEVVRLLLNDNRVDPSAWDNEAIICASREGHVEIVQLLLSDNRVDPSACYNEAIICASREGHVEVVRLLLSDNRVDSSIINNKIYNILL